MPNISWFTAGKNHLNRGPKEYKLGIQVNNSLDPITSHYNPPTKHKVLKDSWKIRFFFGKITVWGTLVLGDPSL